MSNGSNGTRAIAMGIIWLWFVYMMVTCITSLLPLSLTIPSSVLHDEMLVTMDGVETVTTPATSFASTIKLTNNHSDGHHHHYRTRSDHDRRMNHDRYIVTFRTYDDHHNHTTTLHHIINSVDNTNTSLRYSYSFNYRNANDAIICNNYRVITEERPPTILDIPTDFVLLSIDSLTHTHSHSHWCTQSSIMRRLRRHSAIRYIHRDKQLQLQLSWNNDDTNDAYDIDVDDRLPNQRRFHMDAEWQDIDTLPQRAQRRLFQVNHNNDIPQVTTILDADWIWSRGHTGRGIRVAVFDTGLNGGHPHFPHLLPAHRTAWTNERTADDGLGHGTFVAGVIASSSNECPGIAPDVDLRVYRVFTRAQLSYTSWFLDAFNHAIAQRVHVINLSIGGPDFLDRPFVDKVLELSANNIIMVSAIGNDGPLWGSLNNPADQLDVIGVGGIDYTDHMARFSSRGMTTWELPAGYGRVKPDIVTYGKSIRGSAHKNGCRQLSGTSMASPVITGAIALLLSAHEASSAASSSHRHSQLMNPASIKQILIESARRVESASIFEQGNGRLSLRDAYHHYENYIPHASVIPSRLDLTDCPYMWPWCTQELYHTSMPLLVNLTVLNGMSVAGRLAHKPRWYPDNRASSILDVHFTYSDLLWPWSGYIGVSISVQQHVNEPMVASGVIGITVLGNTANERSSINVTVKMNIIPTPPRSKRIIWDQFHNLRYPSGYFPRDNLEEKTDVLDWNGDHLHTNFKEIYDFLRSKGYYIEVMGHDLTCFDASLYGTLLIVDPEEEYFKEEINKIAHDVGTRGLSLIVIADWYNTDIMQQIKFFDENTKRWWHPLTGGANLPALNDLLQPFGIAFGDGVWHGMADIIGPSVAYSSGTSIAEFPAHGWMLSSSLQHVVIDGHTSTTEPYVMVPILGALPSDGVAAVLATSSGITTAAAAAPISSSRYPRSRMYNASDIVRPSMPSEDNDSGHNDNNNSGDNNDSGDIITGRRAPGATINGDNGDTSSNNGVDASLMTPGRVIVYGDSNCMDMNHRATPPCLSLLAAMLDFTMGGDDGQGVIDPSIFTPSHRLPSSYRSDTTKPPHRLSPADGHQATIAEYNRYSKVTSHGARPKCGTTTNGHDAALDGNLQHQHDNDDDNDNSNGHTKPIIHGGNGGGYNRPGTADDGVTVNDNNGRDRRLIRADRMVNGSGRWSTMMVYILFALLIFVIFYLSRGSLSALRQDSNNTGNGVANGMTPYGDRASQVAKRRATPLPRSPRVPRSPSSPSTRPSISRII